MKKIKKIINTKKDLIINFIFTICSYLVLYGTLHLLVYPFVNKTSDANNLGNIVFYMSIINIFAQTFGNSLCNTRQVMHKTGETNNSDYNFLLVTSLVLTTTFSVFIFNNYFTDIKKLFLTTLITLVSVIRYYSTTYYKIKIDFKFGFKFLSIISVGYLVGIGIYYLTNNWCYIFLSGEILGIIYIFFKTPIFKKSQTKLNLKPILKTLLPLAFSYLLVELTSNLDRLIFKNLINEETIAIYYVVSLIGKTLLILTGPINSLALSYLSNSKEKQTQKIFIKTFLLYSLLSFIFYILSVISTPIFAYCFYPNLYEQIKNLNLIVNATQVINFAAALPLIYILTELGSKTHFKINFVYSLLFIPTTYICTIKFGLNGYIYASLLVNIMKYILIFIYGYLKFPREQV